MEELVNYGALGIMLVGFLGGFVVARPTNDRLIAERDRAEMQRDQMVADVLERVVPTLERASEAIKARASHDDEIREVLVDVRRLLESR